MYLACEKQVYSNRNAFLHVFLTLFRVCVTDLYLTYSFTCLLIPHKSPFMSDLSRQYYFYAARKIYAGTLYKLSLLSSLYRRISDILFYMSVNTL
jgi:hypothetical protein